MSPIGIFPLTVGCICLGNSSSSHGIPVMYLTFGGTPYRCCLGCSGELGLEGGCGCARGLCGGFWSRNCCCPKTPALPPMLNPKLADIVVATVEKLISLPFPNRVNILDSEGDVPPVPDEPLYMDDAAETGTDPFWSLRHEVTDAALVRPLYVLAPGDRSQNSCRPPREGGEAESQPLRCCWCPRPRHAVPLDGTSNPADAGAGVA